MTTVILAGGYLLAFLALPHLLLSGKRPVATLAWAWFILLMPFLGVMAYFAVGTDRMRRVRLRRTSGLTRQSRRIAPIARGLLAAQGDGKRRLLRSLEVITDLPVSVSGSAQFLVGAERFYAALERAIEEAHHHIHFELFIWRKDETGVRFRDLLAAAAARGVEVRLVCDQMGSAGTRTSFFAPLVAAGGRFAWFYSGPYGKHLRFANLRNHRKLQIIDGSIAFVGGMNIGDDCLGRGKNGVPWRDAQMRVSGGVIGALQETFATDWLFATGELVMAPTYFAGQAADGEHLVQVIAGGPDLRREPIPKTLAALCSAAERRLWIGTGYFCPDTLMLASLQLCAARGVDVRLLISEKSDHPYLLQVGRSFYEDLLSFGVRIFEYSAGINHAKTVLLDQDWLMVGSANSDIRSMRLNFELNLLVHAPEAARGLERMLEEDFEASKEVMLAEVRTRTWRRTLLEAALRPLAPLL